MVEPDPSVRDGRGLPATKLRYEISAAPVWPIPASLVSQLVRTGLPANICAIAERAEEVGRFFVGGFVAALHDCALPCMHPCGRKPGKILSRALEHDAGLDGLGRMLA